MSAVPAVRPVTTPAADTIATEVLLDSQVTVLLVAFSGPTVAVACVVDPASIDEESKETETEVGRTSTPLLV